MIGYYSRYKTVVKEWMELTYAERRREQAEQTEKKIIQTAFDLMRKKDYDQVSVRDICKAANITTGAFYHHFSAKEDMLRRGFAPLDYHLEQLMEGRQSDPPMARLELLADGYASFVEQELGKLAGQYYMYRLSSRLPEALDSKRFTYQAMMACVEELAAAGQMTPGYTTEEVARFCMRHFRGIVIDWILHDYSYSLVERFRVDYALMCRMFHI